MQSNKNLQNNFSIIILYVYLRRPTQKEFEIRRCLSFSFGSTPESPTLIIKHILYFQYCIYKITNFMHYTDEKFFEVRDYLERLVEGLVDGGLDDVCLTPLSTHPQCTYRQIQYRVFFY